MLNETFPVIFQHREVPFFLLCWCWVGCREVKWGLNVWHRARDLFVMQKDFVKIARKMGSSPPQFKISIYHLPLSHSFVGFFWLDTKSILDLMSWWYCFFFQYHPSMWMRNVKSPWLESHTWRWQVMSPSYKKSVVSKQTFLSCQETVLLICSNTKCEGMESRSFK